jgi:hypothetical protein
MVPEPTSVPSTSRVTRPPVPTRVTRTSTRTGVPTGIREVDTVELSPPPYT